MCPNGSVLFVPDCSRRIDSLRSDLRRRRRALSNERVGSPRILRPLQPLRASSKKKRTENKNERKKKKKRPIPDTRFPLFSHCVYVSLEEHADVPPVQPLPPPPYHHYLRFVLGHGPQEVEIPEGKNFVCGDGEHRRV